MSKRSLVIAIDGPAGSGKSTTARLVADRLGILHIDTGAMYRAVTVKVLERGVSPDDAATISQLMDSTNVELRRSGSVLRVFLDGKDVTAKIREHRVTQSVSAVSKIRGVREAMVRRQRSFAEHQGVVLEGRDIGTVVFPDADLKIFLVASLDARAKRRQAELKTSGIDTPFAALKEDIVRRDTLDSTREESPLKAASDAIELDTSEMTIDEQVDYVVKQVKEIMEKSKR